MTSSLEENLKRRTSDQLFGVRRSCRYHNHRRRFYEIWNTCTVALAALGGSFAATTFVLLDQTWPSVTLALAVSFAGAVDLAVGASRRANQHAELSREFVFLEAVFISNSDIDDSALAELTRKRLEIESREPTELRLLDAMCHFELLRAMGDAKEHPKIPWRRRKLAH